ncbi:MAG TPA: phosphoribosylanthranilate isomerase [Elusimicrobiota bacterium]|jgi:phosphoribosylanthranilate isomerase|nr:phosphoribosylanthranilate isomerase [Elusimicrobiota bacterium]
MAEMRVKFCGITRAEDAAAAAAAGAWAIGMIFAESPRRLDAAQARSVAAAVPAGVLKVGVFSGQSLEEMRELGEETGLDLYQLHDGGDEELVEELGAERCIQAASLRDAASVERAVGLPARFALLDRPRQGAIAEGAAVDRTLAAEVARRRPRVILAGGLTPENVAEAVRRVRPWAVDVSSGVERAPGVKDAAKLRAFAEAAREGAR